MPTGGSNTLGRSSKQCHTCSVSAMAGFYTLISHNLTEEKNREKDRRHQRPIQVSPTVLDGHVVDDAEHDERGHLLRHVPRPRHQPHTVP